MNELDRHEWERRAAKRMLAAIVVLTLLAAAFLLCGCADMSRRDTKPNSQSRASGESLKWARQWELLASAAEAETWAAEHDRLLDAMEHAAAMRDGRAEIPILDAPRPMYESKADAKPDPTAATLNRAAEALAELGGGDRDR